VAAIAVTLLGVKIIDFIVATTSKAMAQEEFSKRIDFLQQQVYAKLDNFLYWH
jgi:hypothetical protein